jgi:hypothetical protein
LSALPPTNPDPMSRRYAGQGSLWPGWPGGWFVASIVHPCLPGSEQGLSSWPPGDAYEREGFWTSPDHSPEGVRIRVGATHRKLSTFLNALHDAGLEAERFVEPPAPVPTYLLWRSRRH